MRTSGAPGLLRRFAAILYDALLLVAILMLVTAALLFFTGGHAISPGNPAYRCLLLVTGVLFFASFWIRDGQTLVIGGLINTQESEMISKVPILGDIPILGYLFKTRTTKETQSQVIFMVRPSIIPAALPLFDPGI